MIVFVAVDNNNGLMFNARRQSQDRILRKNILEDCENCRLWMNSYSGALFDDSGNVDLIIDDDFLEKAKDEDMCYVETDDLHGYEEQISKIIMYRWNRDYPADLYFKIDLMNGNWDMISTCDFEGSSHKVITKEVWVKRCFQ